MVWCGMLHVLVCPHITLLGPHIRPYCYRSGPPAPTRRHDNTHTTLLLANSQQGMRRLWLASWLVLVLSVSFADLVPEEEREHFQRIYETKLEERRSAASRQGGRGATSMTKFGRPNPNNAVIVNRAGGSATGVVNRVQTRQWRESERGFKNGVIDGKPLANLTANATRHIFVHIVKTAGRSMNQYFQERIGRKVSSEQSRDGAD